MPVLTQAELEKFELNKTSKAGDSSSPAEEEKKYEKKRKILKKLLISKHTLWLLHPENSRENPLNFEDEITINGITYKRKIKKGIIKTKDIPLINFLKKKGYIEIHKEK